MRTASVIAVLFAVTTVAAVASDNERPDFGTLDKNHDGRISRGEVPADMPLLKSRYASFDRDHNGRLDQGEFITALRSIDPKGSDPRIYGSGSPEHNPPLPTPRANNSNGN